VRIWSIHPQYLDSIGLIALWRESLLARKVLKGETKGYRHHPQLERFKNLDQPLMSMDFYLGIVWSEAQKRGFKFDATKFQPIISFPPIPIPQGQAEYEMEHLKQKLALRSPQIYQVWQKVQMPLLHPLFVLVEGKIASWEKI